MPLWPIAGVVLLLVYQRRNIVGSAGRGSSTSSCSTGPRHLRPVVVNGMLRTTSDAEWGSLLVDIERAKVDSIRFRTLGSGKCCNFCGLRENLVLNEPGFLSPLFCRVNTRTL
jgi:hypothetical protein